MGFFLNSPPTALITDFGLTVTVVLVVVGVPVGLDGVGTPGVPAGRVCAGSCSSGISSTIAAAPRSAQAVRLFSIPD